MSLVCVHVLHCTVAVMVRRHFNCPHTHSGGRVVHSYGRLIPYQFPITHPHQISYFNKEGLHGHRVTCNVTDHHHLGFTLLMEHSALEK